MTTITRSAAVRTIASSLCFDSDPPVIRVLGKAREAAESIYDALVGIGALPADQADDGPVPLFPDQAAAG